MAQTYRTAIIGCGGRGRAHAHGLRADARCNVVALADIKPEAAARVNEENGFGATVYTDYRELLEKERPDIVAVCLWTGLHLPVARTAWRP
jgi:predicted dehydrogenase